MLGEGFRMHYRIMLVTLLLSLSTIGSSCVNEGVLVSVNLDPIIGRYKLGTSTTFAGTIVVKLDSLISNEYKNKIKQARIYDLRVKVEGEYAGTIAGLAGVQVGAGNMKQIVRFPKTGVANWSTFYTSQSLLGNSPYLSPQSEGISELLTALTSNPPPVIYVSAIGTLSVAPVPDNLYVTVEVYIQGDAELN